ncbi:MAG: hypothetical protein KAT11_00020 [Phycisphaerae bacterium]|nr:hypothetical protein [Phycisphaerae bacterium]
MTAKHSPRNDAGAITTTQAILGGATGHLVGLLVHKRSGYGKGRLPVGRAVGGAQSARGWQAACKS